jgi:putative salt-induced outer membrane protein YdiY
MMRRAAGCVSAVLALALLPNAVAAQDPGFTWGNQTELSYVSTSGNASSSTFGLKGSLEGEGGPHQIRLEFGGVRASSATTLRSAIGTPTDFTIVEVERSETTAESYFARSRYDRDFGAGFGFTGLGWDRNTFSGIRNRFQIVAGLGRTFVQSEAARLKADVGLTYTIQKDVDPRPDANEGFGGWRVSVDGMRAVSPNAQLNSELVLNNSFEDPDDVRADWLSSLSVSINQRLALKTSLQLLWDNVPAQLSVPLETPDRVPTGVNVLTPSAKLDSVVTVTLVIRL